MGEQQRLAGLGLVKGSAASTGDHVSQAVAGNPMLEIVIVTAEYDFGLIGQEIVQQGAHLARAQAAGFGGVGPHVRRNEHVGDLGIILG